MKDVSSRFLPFVWWPLLILFATGAIMIIGEPARSLKNPAFQLKMILLVAALVVTGLFQFFERRNAAFGDLGTPTARRRGDGRDRLVATLVRDHLRGPVDRLLRLTK